MELSNSITNLVEKRAQSVTAMRELLNKADADGKRKLTGDEDAKFNTIDADITAIDAQIAQLQRADAAAKQQADFASTAQPPMLNVNAAAHNTADIKAQNENYEKAFVNYLRHGIGEMAAEDKMVLQAGFRAADGRNIRAAQTLTTTGGGYLIPQGFSGKLDVALKAFGGILGVCEEFTTETGNPLPYPTVDDTAQEGEILGVNTQLNEQGFTFGQVIFGAFTHNSKSVLVPLQLIQDSFFSLDSVVANLLGTRLGRGMNHKLTTGAGTTEPSGLVTEVVAANNVYTTTAGQTGTIIADDLIELEHKVDPAYRGTAKYMFNDATLKAIKKLKDSYGRYLWLPGLSATDPNTINGYPYVINQHMADIGREASPVTGKHFALFGDFSKYKVRRVADVTVMRLVERYADYLQVGFQAFLRYDAKLIDAGTHPIAVAVQAAS